MHIHTLNTIAVGHMWTISITDYSTVPFESCIVLGFHCTACSAREDCTTWITLRFKNQTTLHEHGVSPLLNNKTMQLSNGTAIHCIRLDFCGNFKVTLSDDDLKDSQEGQLEHKHPLYKVRQHSGEAAGAWASDLLYLYARASGCVNRLLTERIRQQRIIFIADA